MQEMVNVISYKSIALFLQKKGGLQHKSGAIVEFFEFMLSITVKNALLASRRDITFIIDLVLLLPYTHICIIEWIMARENDSLGILQHSWMSVKRVRFPCICNSDHISQTTHSMGNGFPCHFPYFLDMADLLP